MPKLHCVYDGKIADEMNMPELIRAILNEFKVEHTDNIIRAMEEAHRCGFIAGEEYGVAVSKGAGDSK